MTKIAEQSATATAHLERKFRFLEPRAFVDINNLSLNWVPEYYIEICKELFLKEVDTFHAKNTSLVVNKSSTSSSSGEEDCFYDIDKKNEMRCSVQPIFNSNIEALSYLESKTKDLDSLNNYPNVKNIFLKYNTTLPSSAPVERLFNCGQQIFVPHRNRLSDNTFERLLFKKKNLYSLFNKKVTAIIWKQ
ncbi:hypothetical protein X777_06184 [Ooceraea biroi]|uniref:HAT C-terminal dimerisation domain-containing protein n=1 Tax=Ooceraea biroi TaxID=2015173 RepID=A0A026WDW6_OOCBI|nr:hypothetical protein X777_06184 [Ooceraea biroi]